MNRPTIYKSLLLICLLLNILQLPAQTGDVIDLCKLAKQPIYVLGDKNNERWSFTSRFYVNNNSVLNYGGKTITLSLQDLNTMTNKDSVYRLTVYYDAYMNIPVSLLDFPNLQELNLINCSFIPKNLDRFKKLQILKIWGDEYWWKYSLYYDNNIKHQACNLGYVFAPPFPKEIANLPELRILVFSQGWQHCALPLPMPDLSHLLHLNYMELKNFYAEKNYSLPHISFLLNKNMQSNGLNMVLSKNLPDCINQEELREPYLTSVSFANYCRLLEKLWQPQIIEVVGELQKGVAHGKYLVYMNGKLTQERFYKKGVEVGVWTLWDSAQIKHEFVDEGDSKNSTKTQYFFTKGQVDSIINYFYKDSLNTHKEIIQLPNNDYANRIEKLVNSKGEIFVRQEYKNNSLIYEIYHSIESGKIIETKYE